MYDLKIERQVIACVSSKLILKEMGLELRSRISFSHCVAFFILQLFLFSVTALLKLNFSPYYFSIKPKICS